MLAGIEIGRFDRHQTDDQSAAEVAIDSSGMEAA
jgi:hypothetical protein